MSGFLLVGKPAFWLAVFISVYISLASSSIAQTAPQNAPRGQGQGLLITVTDENGVAVPSARVLLQTLSQSNALRCETGFAGHCQFTNLQADSYQVRVEKEGFYAMVLPTVQVGATANLDVTLSHQQEVREVVDVVESPPAIDPAQISAQEKLSGLDIINIPYPNTRDYRNALNFIPGVVQDTSGQPHLAGAETYQTLTLLDGFNVTQPGNGLLLLRVSPDAIRSVDVETSRIPAEDGKDSGGVLRLNTGIGDDHYRFSATNFIPSLQSRKGVELDSVDPRVTFSGPIRKGKVWFYDALDGEYDNVVIPQLPTGADHDFVWRVDNLAKMQTNFTSRNILSSSFLINRFHDAHTGLSPPNPLQATLKDFETVYVGTIKDQHYFAGGELLEFGVGFDQYTLRETPLGTASYYLTPEMAIGNNYLAAQTRARRWQTLANLYLPSRQWHGRHEFKLGVDLDRLAYDAHFARRPISFLQEGQKPLAPPDTCLTGPEATPPTPSPCSRYSTFPGVVAHSAAHNFESGAYVEDRWLITNRLLVEPGVRFDWDQIVRHPLVSPRIAATYVLDSEGNTKLSAGIGIVYDATNLLLIARPSAGQRVDQFFDATGNPINPPVSTTFIANTNPLQSPRFLNWSVGVEKKLPAAIYLKAEFIQKRGVHGLVYNTLAGEPSGSFVLQNTRKDHYRAFQLNLRRSFNKNYIVVASYTRSKSVSNQVLDINVDNPVFSPPSGGSLQAAGPYPWDVPNRFLSWGLVPFLRLPLIHKFDIAYSMETRSGFPFSVVNSQPQLVEPPGSLRFPTYFSLNVHLEKRFHLFGAYWAVRGGFNNITDHKNYLFVDNDVDSPHFPSFSVYRGRIFTARIRSLGRK